MAATKKYKRLTNAEKKRNAQVRKELRAAGVIPPVKPRLNRKKFADEVDALWDAEMGDYGAGFYLATVIGFTLGRIKGSGHVTEEDIGVLKLMRAAVEYRRMAGAAEASGQPLTIGQLYDGIRRIMEL